MLQFTEAWGVFFPFLIFAVHFGDTCVSASFTASALVDNVEKIVEKECENHIRFDLCCIDGNKYTSYKKKKGKKKKKKRVDLWSL